MFWYFPFTLLHVLVSFQCFLRFCGLFPVFCCVPCSCFADFTFFFNFTACFSPFCYHVLQFWYVAVLSFQLAICWSQCAMFRAGLIQHFGFTLLVCCSLRDDKEREKPDSQISALHLHNYFRNVSPWLHHSSIFPRLFCNTIHCMSFCPGKFDNKITKKQRTTKINQKQHHVRSHVAKENSIVREIIKNNITNITTNNIAKI